MPASRAARRGRGARRAAAQGPRRSAAVGAITNLLARRRTALGAKPKGHAYSLLLAERQRLTTVAGRLTGGRAAAAAGPGGALAAAAGGAAGGARTGTAAGCDHACADGLTDDDLEAEEEKTEIEAEVDIAEGGGVQI